MKWPWHRDKTRLHEARREQQEIVRRGRDREPMLDRVERDGARNQFAERWRRALGGTP